MKTKALLFIAALAAAGVGGYWYYSPHLAMQSMQKAAKANDAETFNEHVDYPKLRESFKGQMSALLAEQLGQSTGTSGAESLGAMLGLAMVNNFVDAFVRPEVVMRAMQNGEFSPEEKAAGPSGEGSKPKEPDWTAERQGMNKVIAYGRDPDEGPDAKAVGIVFERYGFADWKLTEVRLPDMK